MEYKKKLSVFSMDELQTPKVSPIVLFYSYAHEDERLRQKLERHLSLLRQQGLITEWHDHKIVPGTDWAHAIDAHLNSASVILLLISSHFLASDYCNGVEMRRALERHQANEACVIPILLRPVDWQRAPFAHLQMLPTGARAITSWGNQDEAFVNVAVGIRRVIEDLPRLTGLSVSDKPEPVELTSHSTRSDTSIPLPPVHRNPPRVRRWSLVAIVTFVVLLGVVGGMIMLTLWHANSTASEVSAAATATAIAACGAAPTLIGPVDGQMLSSRTVILTWEAPQGCLPDGYTVRISADYDPEARPW